MILTHRIRPPRPSRRPVSRPRPTFRPGVEALERRVLLSWTLVASLPVPRSGLGAATGVNGQVYAVGGADATSNPVASTTQFPAANNTWVPVADMITARSKLAVL